MRLSETEAKITSVERVHRTMLLPSEASSQLGNLASPPKEWPSRGELHFDNVCMHYREGLPLVLKNVSFRVPAGSRCGVIGRTGSGKTSLANVLFRLVELMSGRILLDGLDLSQLGLSDVRGRPNGMRMIPQDPVLFAGTVRECLDPFGLENDDRILEALQAVGHKGASDRDVAILDDPVEEGGRNYSVGQRQLLCLARAIVEEPRVLVLDEATACIDTESDTCIQEMLRARFQDTTLLTIAHRLHTIMDYDFVIVMDDGKCVEFGSPKDLLENDQGLFSTLVGASFDNVSDLRRIASQTKSTKHSNKLKS